MANHTRKTGIVARLTAEFFNQTLCRWLPVEVEGLSNLPNGPFILAANHESFIDSVITCAKVLPHRDLTPLVGHVFFKFPFNSILKSINAVPVDRSKGLTVGALKSVLTVLKTSPVLIFPEGTRTRTQDVENTKSGLGFLAKASGQAVVPLAIVGTAKVLPIGAKRFNRSPVKMIVCKPIFYDPKQSYEDFSRDVMKSIFDTCAQYATPSKASV